MTAKDESLVTPAQLRRHLAVSKPTYLGFVREGMPVVRLGARMWRFELAAVMKWLEERQQEKAAPTSGDA